VIKLGELVMILDLHRQGLSISQIARRLDIDRKTVRTHLAKGLEPPAYKKRMPAPGVLEGFASYLRERMAAYPGLTATRLWREIKERGFAGGYSTVREGVRDLRPPRRSGFEVRFETPPGEQAQVDFARFEVEFADEPGVKRIVWLFSMVMGCSRLIWARFVLHQDLQTVLRCHMAAFEALGGAPRTILYDRMKTAVIGEDAEGLVIYNRALVDLARHYGFQPRARIVNEAFAEEKPFLQALPQAPYRAVVRLERRVSHEGMISVGGNLYSVPDTTRRRVFDVHVLADEVRIFEDGALVASHAPLEGRGQKQLDPDHRKPMSFPRRRPGEPDPAVLTRAGDHVACRPLDFYAAVGRRLANPGAVR
jgi:transposase